MKTTVYIKENGIPYSENIKFGVIQTSKLDRKNYCIWLKYMKNNWRPTFLFFYLDGNHDGKRTNVNAYSTLEGKKWLGKVG